MASTPDLLSAFDLDSIPPEALLFQTGYLTTVGTKDRLGETLLRLGYPNREVRQSLNQSLMANLLPPDSRRTGESIELVRRLANNDFAGLEEGLAPF